MLSRRCCWLILIQIRCIGVTNLEYYCGNVSHETKVSQIDGHLKLPVVFRNEQQQGLWTCFSAQTTTDKTMHLSDLIQLPPYSPDLDTCRISTKGANIASEECFIKTTSLMTKQKSWNNINERCKRAHSMCAINENTCLLFAPHCCTANAAEGTQRAHQFAPLLRCNCMQ